jgi:hypothetical protein
MTLGRPATHTLVALSIFLLLGCATSHTALLSSNSSYESPDELNIPGELKGVLEAHSFDPLKKELSEPQFADEARRREFSLNSLMASHTDPYYGLHTPSETCAEGRMSNFNSQSSASELILGKNLFATKNHVFGACSESLDIYKSQVMWIFCKQTRHAFELRYFYSKSEPWLVRPIARCRL